MDEPKSADTFPKLIRAAARAFGETAAITLRGEGAPDESLTFLELDHQSAQLARGLIARGVGKGSRIGFIYGNGPSFALMLAAICRIGAVAIPISTLLKSSDLVRVLRQCDASGLIVQRRFLGNDYVERLCESLPELRESDSPDLRLSRTPYLRWIVSTGDALPPTVHDMDYLTRASDSVSAALLLEIESEVHPSDQMMEIYTSGSMALPKGVKHSHGPVMSRSHYIRSKIDLERGMQVRVPLPMFWVGGLMMFLLPNWEVGATTICTERTSSDRARAAGGRGCGATGGSAAADEAQTTPFQLQSAAHVCGDKVARRQIERMLSKKLGRT
jgi:acyl-CoA synthetase (AMP-forming)/AMP-acid ligase II